MVQWTISSDERRELGRAAGPASRAFDAQIDPPDRFVRLRRSRLTPEKSMGWASLRSANPV